MLYVFNVKLLCFQRPCDSRLKLKTQKKV